MNLYIALAVAAGLSFLIAFLLGFVIIPWLRKLKFGQTILDIGPVWHKSKQGTPIMGGAMFILGSLVAIVVGVAAYSAYKTSIEGKIGRNDKCVCGSGKKYKQCCGRK